MTRLYKAIAAVIRKQRSLRHVVPVRLDHESFQAGYDAALHGVEVGIADSLQYADEKRKRPSFNRARFLAQCRLKD